MSRQEPFEGCMLWERARIKALDKGLQMHGECPVDAFCEGTRCIFIAPNEEPDPDYFPTFKQRIEEDDQRKLQKLKKEIGDMCGSDPLTSRWPAHLHFNERKRT